MKHLAYAAIALVLVAGGIVAIESFGSRKEAKPLTTAGVARKDRGLADSLYETPKAKEAYLDFVKKWEASPDKKVQDEVGAARLRLAYLDAKKKDYKAARDHFNEAAKAYNGTGRMSSDFGGVKDQALYQAAVCLNALGKTKEYRQALVDFIEKQPLSPLVNAAYKRLVKLDGKAKPEVAELLQKALDAQQKHIRFETSVCGPKALVYLLKKLGKGDLSYKTLAKECGTTDQGTTLGALKACLKNHGVNAFGYALSRKDAEQLRAPALLMSGDHYLVLDHRVDDDFYVYDPMVDMIRKISLPSVDTPDFQLPALSLTLLDLDAN